MNQEMMAVKNGIDLVCVKDMKNQEGSVHLLPHTIKGAEVYYHSLKRGKTLKLDAQEGKLRTFLLIDGAAVFTAGVTEGALDKRGSYVVGIGKETVITVSENTHILEVLWKLDDAGERFLKEHQITFPIRQIYEECSQYREDFKSKKCISRSMIDHHILPSFCMGSNESYGPDLVQQHAHPLIDQFFFSFEENDVDLLIDNYVQPLEGDTLVRIPLGSNHGVRIPEGKKMHYVWIDFMVDPGAVAYLDEVHKKTGVQERFDENHQITK